MQEMSFRRTPEHKAAMKQPQLWEEVLLDLTRTPSVTGSEREVALKLESHLAKHFPDARIYRQHVSDARWNVIMERGEPRLTLTTHLDVVPGGPVASYTNERLYGRGACDAKGQIVAQLWGLHQAVAEGISDYRCAYVVGEETDAVGARTFMSLPTTEFILNGEPTRNRFISRSWGALEVEVSAKGKEAHSSLGTHESAIHKLMDDVVHLRRNLPAGIDMNVGVIRGGTAPNIQAGAASCDLCIRIRGDAAPARELLWQRLQNTEWREKSPPTEGLSLFVPEFAPERDVEVRFASDCSVYAQGYDKVMLFGPGHIANAHTDNEHIDRRELELAALMIAKLVVSIEAR
jgi:acetylornithine deacetylase/succinyl-diaminopimelate desuccinylase-like protein